MGNDAVMTAEELRQRRLALGLISARFALFFGAHPGTYIAWESGKHPVPAWVEEKLIEVEASRWPRRT